MRRVELTVAHAGIAGSAINNVHVTADRIWAVGGANRRAQVLVSTDGGRTFAERSAPPTVHLRDALRIDATLWVVGDYGRVYRTAAGDDAAEWEPVRIPGTGVLYDIQRDASGRIWIVGDEGLVLRSPSGKRFSRVESRCTGRVFALLVEATSTWAWDSDGTLQRAHRNKAFVEVAIDAMQVKRPLTALARTPAQTLILVGDGGMVLRSTTDGASWKKIVIHSRVDLEKIAVTPYGIFVVGDRGSLLVSHDDGRSFQGLESDLATHVWTIEPCGRDLLIGGDDGTVYRLAERELALLLRDAHRGVLADLASRVAEGEPGADLVLDDALRERTLW